MDDLLGAAAFGLMDAVERYNPRMGTRFETYCAVRIRGAVLDELRYLRSTPRAHVSRGAAGEPGRGEQRLRGRLATAHPEPRRKRSCLSLSASHTESEDIRRLDIVAAQEVCDPAVLLQEKERRDLLAREVRRLRATERLLVMLYYFDELTMKQIGQLLKLTESRVSQMHTEILERLQQRLARIEESMPRQRVHAVMREQGHVLLNAGEVVNV